jgi:malate dehydrogenase (oxaloacetate-decarboxylating)
VTIMEENNTSTARTPAVPGVLDDPILNRGVAFTTADRKALGLTGRLPSAVLTVVFGAGTAGVGIADQLRDAMVRDGASEEQATAQVWLVDKQGCSPAT